jgi:signal transduction histidine kinase
MFTETLLLGRVRSDAEARKSLEIVDREARRLGRLVENILLFARGQRGSVPLACSRQPLAPIVCAVIDELAPMAAARDVTVHTHLDEAAVAEVDAGAIHQMLINLLDNAIKYGPRGQQVKVTLRVENGHCRLAVDDQGPGIPARDRKRIWQSYRRLERDRRAAIAGTGIGLAVVRDLVARHGGTVGVTAVPAQSVPAQFGSRGGARFEISLPAASQTALETAIETEGGGKAVITEEAYR